MITALKGDTYRYSCEYAVTLTLSPHMYNKDTIIQAKSMTTLFHKLVKREYGFCQRMKISAFLEETKDYNIHLHALIQVNMDLPLVQREGARKFLFNTFRDKNLGKIKDIEQVANADSWRKYIVKDLNKDHFGYDAIVFDDYGLAEDDSLRKADEDSSLA